MGFGLSLINCSKTAPFLTTQWVPDHEGSTVGVGEGQSNDSLTYNKNKPSDSFLWVFLYPENQTHNLHYVIFFIFKKRLDNYDTLVYTSSVVNREVIRNVVDML